MWIKTSRKNCGLLEKFGERFNLCYKCSLSNLITKLCTEKETALSLSLFYDTLLTRSLSKQTKTWTKHSGKPKMIYDYFFEFLGFEAPIGAGPAAPWDPPTAFECRANGKPSTRFWRWKVEDRLDDEVRERFVTVLACIPSFVWAKYHRRLIMKVTFLTRSSVLQKYKTF